MAETRNQLAETTGLLEENENKILEGVKNNIDAVKSYSTSYVSQVVSIISAEIFRIEEIIKCELSAKNRELAKLRDDLNKVEKLWEIDRIRMQGEINLVRKENEQLTAENLKECDQCEEKNSRVSEFQNHTSQVQQKASVEETRLKEHIFKKKIKLKEYVHLLNEKDTQISELESKLEERDGTIKELETDLDQMIKDQLKIPNTNMTNLADDPTNSESTTLDDVLDKENCSKTDTKADDLSESAKQNFTDASFVSDQQALYNSLSTMDTSNTDTSKSGRRKRTSHHFLPNHDSDKKHSLKKIMTK